MATLSGLVKDPSPPATDTETAPITIVDGTTLITTKPWNAIVDIISGDHSSKIPSSALDTTDNYTMQNLDVEGYMAVGNGSSLDERWTANFDRDFTVTNSSGTAAQVNISGRITQISGKGAAALVVNPEETIVPDSTTVPYITSVALVEPKITNTAGPATIDIASTLRIVSAPTEGDLNYALHVDAGDVRIDDNLGIGVTSISNKVDIAESAADVIQQIACYSTTNSHRGYLAFQKSGSATIGTLSTTSDGEILGQINFRGVDVANNQETGAYIVGHQDGAAGGRVPGRLSFFTATDSTAAAERMRIDSSGNVGIGITPTEKLHVFDSSAVPILKVEDGSASSATSGAQLTLLQDDGAAISQDHRMGRVLFQAAENGTSQLRAGGAIEVYAEQNWSTTINDAYMAFYTNEGNTNFTEKMRIDSVGNVGIGMTPTDFVEIGKSDDLTRFSIDTFSTTLTDRPIIKLRKSASTTIGTYAETGDTEDLGEIQFLGVDNGGNPEPAATIRVIQDGASGVEVPAYMAFYTSTSTSGHTERMRITSEGAIEMPEISTPSNPPANSGSFYVADDGGTTKLYFRDSAGTETDLLAGGGGGGSHIIEDEGTPLTARSNLNFTGALVTATDNSPDTDVTIAIPNSHVTNAMLAGSIDTSKLSDSANIVLTNQANTYGGFAQTFTDDSITILNPATTSSYRIRSSAITTVRDAILPLLGGDDTFVFEAHSQTLTNKTLTTPTIASFTNATHDHSNAAGGGNIAHTAISDFDAGVQTNRLDQMAAPTADVSANSNKITNLTNGSAASDAAAFGQIPTSFSFTDTIPCVLETPQGSEAYADVHVLSTQGSKITGFVMPTANDSTINFKVSCPEDLAGTPGVIFRVYTLTLSANTTDAVNLTFDARYTGDTENMDQAFNQSVTATNYNVSDTIESMDYHDITPTNSPTAGEMITGQIFRDVSADAAGDVMIVGISMLIDRTVT